MKNVFFKQYSIVKKLGFFFQKFNFREEKTGLLLIEKITYFCLMLPFQRLKVGDDKKNYLFVQILMRI